MNLEYDFPIIEKKPKLVKRVDIGYAYTTFLAFLISIKYGNKRRLSIRALKDYRPLLFERFSEASDDDLAVSEKLIINNIHDYSSFLKKYEKYFIIGKDYLRIKDEVTIEEIENILNNMNIPQHDIFIYALSYSSDIKRILGINKVRGILIDYAKLEKQLLKYYLKYSNGELEYDLKIRELLETRNNFYYELLTKGEDFLESCYTEVIGLADPNPYNDHYPVDEKYFEDEEGTNEHLVDDVLCSTQFYAIFTNKDLELERIMDDVISLKCLYSYDLPLENPDLNYEERLADNLRNRARRKGSFVYTTRDIEKTMFYMTYIKKTDELQELYGPIDKLKSDKARLIYLLDDISTNLFDPENFDLWYERFKNEINPEENFSWWYILVDALIPELFEVNESETIKYKKLAIIAAYYELSNDEDVIQLLRQYRNNLMYQKYSSFILGNNKHLSK